MIQEAQKHKDPTVPDPQHWVPVLSFVPLLGSVLLVRFMKEVGKKRSGEV
jgi:hypothetical protein